MAEYEGLAITDGDRLFGMLDSETVFRRCRFDDADLAGIEADSLSLEECSLRGADLTGLLCPALRIRDSALDGAILRGVEAYEAEITGSAFTSADLTRSKLNLSRIRDCDFSGAAFDDANLFGADLTGSRFRGVDLAKALMDGTKLERVDLSLASLRGHGFRSQRLARVNLTEADLAACDFTDAVFDGCYLVGAFMDEETQLDGADLRGAVISGEHLVRASLRGAVMLPTQVKALVFEGFGVVVDDSVPRRE